MTRRWAVSLALVLVARGTRAEEAPSAPSPTISASGQSQDAAPGREVARECFEAGVSFARAGRYSEARAQFLKAYAAKPHFIVLYNIGLVDIQLGNFTSAAQFLRQYLAEGRGAIAAEQRELVVREIERIDAQSAPPLEATGAGVPRVASEPVRARSDLQAESQSSSTQADRRDPSVRRRVLAPKPALEAVDARSTSAGYLLVGGGFAALAGAAVAYIWNHDRYLDWKHRHEELVALRRAGPVSAEDEAALRARIDDTNARLRSVQRFDPVPFVLAGLGVLASGVGVWTLTETNDGSHLRLASQPSELMLETSWTW